MEEIPITPELKADEGNSSPVADLLLTRLCSTHRGTRHDKSPLIIPMATVPVLDNNFLQIHVP